MRNCPVFYNGGSRGTYVVRRVRIGYDEKGKEEEIEGPGKKGNGRPSRVESSLDL